MDAALADFAHPAARRELKWDLARAGWIRQHLSLLRDASQRALVEKFLSLYDTEVLHALPQLAARRDLRRRQRLTTCWWAKRCPCRESGQPHRFRRHARDGDRVGSGDCRGLCILGKENPLRAAAEVVSGYHRAFPLTEAELKILFALITTRLAVSVVNSVHARDGEAG